jgi:hypothetical protein
VAHPQVAAFARLADGLELPVRKIEGARTLLGRTMHSVDYDPLHDEVVLPQQFGQAILTFRGDAAGETPPVRVIQGSNTGIHDASRVALDPVNGEIFVPEGERILVFPRDANGNVAPIRVIEGPETQLGAASIDVDPGRNLLIVGGRSGAPGKGDHILVFDRRAQGNVKPRAIIRGPRTMLTGTQNIRVYPAGGWILIAQDGVQSPRTDGRSFVGVWSIEDSGDVPPRWTIGGPHGKLIKPRGVDLDPQNEALLVSDKELNAVLTYHVPQLFAARR